MAYNGKRIGRMQRHIDQVTRYPDSPLRMRRFCIGDVDLYQHLHTADDHMHKDLYGNGIPGPGDQQAGRPDDLLV
jgi:hypothetical protein